MSDDDELEETIEIINALPGDFVNLTPWDRLESPTMDKYFTVDERIDVHCLCIGRVENTTVSGLTNRRIYLLTSMGVGYKRFNLGGDQNVDQTQRFKHYM